MKLKQNISNKYKIIFLFCRWDYKAAELGDYKLNVTTFWIDLFAKIGWAYDLKQPSSELVRKTIEKHGDGSHPVHGHATQNLQEDHHPVESVAAPGEPNFGY